MTVVCLSSCWRQGLEQHNNIVQLFFFTKLLFLHTAKLAECQKKANNIRRWSGKAVRAPTVQIPIGISVSSTDLQQSGSTGQCSLTAFGPMLISLASAKETIPLVRAIVCRPDLHTFFSSQGRLGMSRDQFWSLLILHRKSAENYPSRKLEYLSS